MTSIGRRNLVSWDQAWVRGCLTWLAYTLSAMLSITLTSQSEQVAPFYLASGVGLACAIAWGPHMLWAVGLGSAAAEWFARWYAAPESLGLGAITPIIISGLGGGLQAALALYLTRRISRADLTLEHPREIGLFLLLAGPMACLFNPTLSVTSMVLSGELPDERALDVFLDWWMGDTMGVLVGAPLTLTLIGQPRAFWRQRRRTVGLPLLVTALVVMAVARQVQVWKDERADHLFQRDTDAAQHTITLTLSGYLNTLEALRGLYEGSDSVDHREFETASRYWLANVPGIQGVGWDQRILASDLSAFEARQREAGFLDYTVFDTRDRLPPQGQELVPVTYFEPRERNARALGYNVLSMPVTRDAFEQARREDKVVATAALTLNQETAQQRGVVVYRAVYRGMPHTPLQRVQNTQGAVFLALRMDDMLQAMLRELPSHLQACLLDVSTGGRSEFLAGAPECQGAQPWQAHRHRMLPVDFAQRQWQMAVWSTNSATGMVDDHMPRLIGAGGMALTAALGALLLVMTGHARRIEAAMQAARAQKQVADDANRAKSEFLSRMSHELRTPLNAVLGFAQVLDMDEQEPLSPAQQQRVHQIQQAGWHLLAMIDDVLDISRVDTGTLQLDVQPGPIAPAIKAALDLMAPLAARHQVILAAAPTMPDDWWAAIDRTRLQQVFVNLLSNAIKYNRPGGHVEVKATLLPAQGRIGERVVLSVEDTGLGMSAAQVGQLFQPFNRLGREQSGTDGTGIGLVITRHLVQAMNGMLQVRSQEGRGSVFTVTLNRLPAAAPSFIRGPSSTAAPASPASPEHPRASAQATAVAPPPSRHVLYVEDNPANSAVIQSALASRTWLRLTVAPTIEEGLTVLHDRVRARRPDLILLDVHLPDASGLELLHLMKANPDTADIPVIMISADALPEQIDAALAAGAACYLTKPVQIPALLVQMDDLLLGTQRRGGA